MAKSKFSASIYFTDDKNELRFLFQIINIGRNSDELKFIFNSPTVSTAVIYSDDTKPYILDALITNYGEVTYHADGSVLYKFPGARLSDKYKNPTGTGSRRTPLEHITKWEPVIQGKIIRYSDCKKQPSNDQVYIPQNKGIFSGNPFEYIALLCRSDFKFPDVSSPDEIIFRLPNIASNIDLVVIITKSNYSGAPFRLGDTEYINDNNLIQVIEKALPE